MTWYKLAAMRIIVVILGFEENRGDAKNKEGCKNLKTQIEELIERHWL